MFFDNLPDMPENMSDEMIETSNQWLSSMLEEQLWWRETVIIKYGISAAMITYLTKTKKIPGCVVVGGKTAFIAKFAKPWFDRYVSGEGKAKRGPKAKVAELNVVTPAGDTEKRKPGRPKKSAVNPDAWRDFTIDGVQWHVPEQYEHNSPHIRRWVGTIHMKNFDLHKAGEMSDEDFDAWKETKFRIFEYFGVVD